MYWTPHRHGRCSRELHPGRHLADRDDPITVTDVARVILGNGQARCFGSADVAEWHRSLLALLLGEMGIGWRDDPDRHHANPLGLPRLAVRMPAMYIELRDPTHGTLEYTPLPGEEAVLGQMLPKVDAATDALRATWHELLAELLLVRWPKARGRTTTLGRLREAGLGERPRDDDDLF